DRGDRPEGGGGRVLAVRRGTGAGPVAHVRGPARRRTRDAGVPRERAARHRPRGRRLTTAPGPGGRKPGRSVTRWSETRWSVAGEGGLALGEEGRHRRLVVGGGAADRLGLRLHRQRRRQPATGRRGPAGGR